MTVLSSPGFDLYYEVDDFTDPWTQPETILLLHGNCESGEAWYAWIPQLARRYRVVRPDMRGFGRSTPMPREYPWTLDALIDDYCRLMDHLAIERFHLVGAKIGGTVARAFAARRQSRVATLTLIGTPTPFRPGAKERLAEWTKEFETQGIEHWARRSMAGRLGDGFPKAGAEWWTKYMGRTALSSQLGFIHTIACVDITPDMPNILCPTLVITTEESGLASVEANHAWADKMRNGRLTVLPGNSYHVAATNPDACARATLDFIARAAAP